MFWYSLIAVSDHQWDREIKILTLPWFQCLRSSFSLDGTLANFLQVWIPVLQFSLKWAVFCFICWVSDVSDPDFYFQTPCGLFHVYIVTNDGLSLFSSSNTGSLHPGFQSHVVRCSPERLSLPFLFAQDWVRNRQRPHLFSVGQGFSTLPFTRFPVNPVSGLSPSLGRQGPMDGPGHVASAALTDLEVSPFCLGDYPCFPNSAVMYLKTCFQWVRLYLKRGEQYKVIWGFIYMYMPWLAYILRKPLKRSARR